jgi:hypothetical protein
MGRNYHIRYLLRKLLMQDERWRRRTRRTQPAKDRTYNRLVTMVSRIKIGAWFTTDCAARFAVRNVSSD